jgi:hypothetical protein
LFDIYGHALEVNSPLAAFRLRRSPLWLGGIDTDAAWRLAG